MAATQCTHLAPRDEFPLAEREEYTQSLFDDREDVVFLHEQQLVAVDLKILAGPGGEDHAIAGLHLQLAAGAVIEQLAVADADHHAALRLLFGSVGQQDAAGGLALPFLSLHD